LTHFAFLHEVLPAAFRDVSLFKSPVTAVVHLAQLVFIKVVIISLIYQVNQTNLID